MLRYLIPSLLVFRALLYKVLRHAFSFHTDEQQTAALDEALSRQPERTNSNGDDDGRGVGEESDADKDFVPVS